MMSVSAEVKELYWCFHKEANSVRRFVFFSSVSIWIHYENQQAET